MTYNVSSGTLNPTMPCYIFNVMPISYREVETESTESRKLASSPKVHVDRYRVAAAVKSGRFMVDRRNE